MRPAAVLPSRCCRRKKHSAAPPSATVPHHQIVKQAQQQGSLNIAISGLIHSSNARQSGAPGGAPPPASRQVNVAVQTNVSVGTAQIAERLIQGVRQEPELKARSRKYYWRKIMSPNRESLTGSIRRSGWAGFQERLPMAWQKQFLRGTRSFRSRVDSAAGWQNDGSRLGNGAHCSVEPKSLSVVACPAHRQSAEAVRKARDMFFKGAAPDSNSIMCTGSNWRMDRVAGAAGSDDSIRGFTVDGWIIADEAGPDAGAFDVLYAQCGPRPNAHRPCY